MFFIVLVPEMPDDRKSFNTSLTYVSLTTMKGLLMKQRSILSCFLLLAFIVPGLNAQENRLFVSIKSGITLPMGSFAATDYEKGGYALTGFDISTAGGWFIKPNLAITVAFSQQFYRFYKNAYLVDFVNNDAFVSHIEMKTDMYEVRTYMAGIAYCHHFNDKFSVSGKAMGGLLWAQTPDQFFGADYYIIGSLYFRRTPAQSTSPAGLAGIDFAYKLFDHVEFRGTADFSYSKASFTFVKNDGTSYTKSYSMPLVTAGAGLNIPF